MRRSRASAYLALRLAPPRDVGLGSRPCENGWSRGVERPRVSAVPIAGVQMFEPLWWLDSSRARSVLTSNGGTALEATFSQPGLRLDRCDQRSGPHDVDDAGEIVGEDVQRHFSGVAWQRRVLVIGEIGDEGASRCHRHARGAVWPVRELMGRGAALWLACGGGGLPCHRGREQQRRRAV